MKKYSISVFFIFNLESYKETDVANMTTTLYIHTDDAILGQIFLFLEMVLCVVFSAKILQNRPKKSQNCTLIKNYTPMFYKHSLYFLGLLKVPLL